MASATKYISASVPSILRPFTPIKTNRALSWVYPRLDSIRSMLGEKMPWFAPYRGWKGMPDTSHNPVQRFSAHSNVKSNESPRLAALPLAAMTSFRQGLTQYFSFARWAISRAPSGFLARHSRATFCQNAGLARYAALLAAFRLPTSIRSRHGSWLLCHWAACFWQQNLVRGGAKVALQIRHLGSSLEVCIRLLYAHNSAGARSFA